MPGAAAAQNVTSLVETVSAPVAPARSVTSTAVTPNLVFPTALAKVANQISTVINSVVTQLVNTFSGYSPFGPQVESPANWLLLAAARRRPGRSNQFRDNHRSGDPTLILNGYSVVPISVQIVDAFTGRWSYWPGQPNMMQGRRDFTIVDPATGEKGGDFSALITSGDPPLSVPAMWRCWSPPTTARTWEPVPGRPAGRLGDFRLHARHRRILVLSHALPNR